MKKFFVGCNLHFEDELERELSEFWPYLIDLDGRPHHVPLQILEKVPGGILLEAPLHLGLQINFFSKLANRVLLRIREFKVKDFPKMVHSFRDLKKDPALKGLELGFQVAAQESRLNNEKRILEILEEVFGRPPATASQTLFVRMHQDLCTVSLDSSGAHLHKRTERTEHGEAPLRETLAAFCARQLLGSACAAETTSVELLDPMCGTGSLLREAESLYQPVFRDTLAFLQWSQTPKIFKSKDLLRNYPEFPRLFGRLTGSDRDPAAIERAQRSLASSKVPVSLAVQDLFKVEARQDSGPCWIISNPPYGERLRAEFRPVELLQMLEKNYHPQKMALLFGENQARQIKELPDFPLKIVNIWKFKNGGLPVQLFLFSRQAPVFETDLDKNSEFQ